MREVPAIDVSAAIEVVNEFSDATRKVANEQDSAYPNPTVLTGIHASLGETIGVANVIVDALTKPDALPARLNRLIDSYDLRHCLDGSANLAWFTTNDSTVAAAVVAAFIDSVNDHGSSRLGTCHADNCIDVYTDRSRAKRRRYCSDQCSSRTRVARWRAGTQS